MVQWVPGSLRPRIILTFRHYKGVRSSAKRTGRLYPSRNPWYPLSEAESTSGHMVLSGVPRKKSPVTPPGIDPGTVRLIAQRLNHYATPGPTYNIYNMHTHTHTHTHTYTQWYIPLIQISVLQRQYDMEQVINTQNIYSFYSVKYKKHFTKAATYKQITFTQTNCTYTLKAVRI